MALWPFSIFGCFFPLMGLAILGLCIRTLWVTLTPPPRRLREPGCGRCGYPVTGLATPECPECGADLRLAGINTPALAMRHRGGLWGAILAWTVLAVTIG